jgi:hypothetical protein
VHVHVHGLGRHLQEEHGGWEAAARQHVAVDLHQRVLEQPVAHGPPVHEQVHAGQRRAVAVGARHQARQAQGAGGLLHADQGRGFRLSQHGRHPVL